MIAGAKRVQPQLAVADTALASTVRDPPNLLVRATFYLFVFSIPFEMPMRDLPLDVPRITGALFLATTLLDLRACYRRVPWALTLFGGYLWVYFASFLVNGGQYPGEVFRLFAQLAQMMLLFWAATHVLRIPRVAQQTLTTFAAACVVRAAVQVFRVPMLATVSESHRVTAFGQNVNLSALLFAAGMLVLIGLQYGRRVAWLRPRPLAWPLLAVLAIALFETGSRGGLAALAIGLIVFTAATPGVRYRLRALLVLVAAFGTFYVAASTSEFMQGRLRQAASGNLAGRERIYPTLAGMWLEKPLLGWGPIANKYELGHRIADPVVRRRGAHNLVLEVLTSTGLAGAAFYMPAMALCFVGAWRGRGGRHGVLPLALLVTLLTANLSGDWPVAPVWWLALALGLASAVPDVTTAARIAQRRVACAA